MSDSTRFSEIAVGDMFWLNNQQYRRVPASRADNGEHFNIVSTENNTDAPLLRCLENDDEVILIQRYRYRPPRRWDDPIGGERQNQHGWGES